MKRILASVLSVAMMVNILPVSSLAVTANASSVIDVQTVRDSTGETAFQDEENSFSGKITDVALTDTTAAVSYTTTEAADLVVAVYTDESEEKMTASGTAAVSASGTVQVTLAGTCLEGYIVKAYLLAREDHAPVSAAYTVTVQSGSDSGDGSEGGTGGNTDTGTEIVASGTCGTSVYWKLDRNGLLTIYGAGDMASYETDMEVPWYNNYRNDIKRVLIESGVTSIASCSFFGCKNMVDVDIPSGVTGIGDAAFYNCSNLKNVTLPEGVKFIGESAFYGCTGLEGIVLPCGMAKIEAQAFRNCTGMKKIVMPDGITNIGAFAFSGCSNLTEVVLPVGITGLERCTFDACSNLKNVVIPEGVTRIGNSVFSRCVLLEGVTMPSSITDIGTDAFYGCNLLTSVTYNGTQAQWKKITVSSGNKCLTDVIVHCVDSDEIDIAKSGTCGTSARWKIDDEGILTIYGAGEMESYEVYSSVPWYNLRGEIKEVLVEEGITSIGARCFYDCGILETVTLPDEINCIGEYSFYGCISLENLNFPTGVVSIEEAAFSGGTALRDVTLPDGLVSIGYAAFSGNNMKNIIIPDSVTTISEGAFSGCGNLVSVRLPEGIACIGKSMFYNCHALESITIPENVVSIGDYAFFGCSNLNDIALPDGLKSIGHHAFENCEGLSFMVFPSELTDIGSYAFGRCVNLKCVTISTGLTKIESNAFKYCAGLATVLYSGTEEQWQAITVESGNTCLTNATITYLGDSSAASSLADENSITAGGVTSGETVLQVNFGKAPQSGAYAVIISRSETEPLEPENLIYINQIDAMANETLSVAFQSGAAETEMVYIVACTRDAADTPDTPNTPSDTPSVDPGPAGSDGGDTGMAAVLIAGVVTVGAVATAALMAPVKVQGVVIPEQGQIPDGMKVILTQNGKIAAQALVEPDGSFELKVKRGRYQLTVSYLEPETGELVERTQSLRAPKKNLKIAV